MAEMQSITAVESMREIRDEQAAALAGKSEEEVVAFFHQADRGTGDWHVATDRLATALPRTAIVLLSTAALATALWLGRAIAEEGEASQTQSFPRRMHQAMAVMDHDMEHAPMTDNPDHDFAAMMIPHHQGAIDMAKVELLYGKDPVLRRMAQEIIVTQQEEIGVMRGQLDQMLPHPRSDGAHP
jgi:hypothetical protein